MFLTLRSYRKIIREQAESDLEHLEIERKKVAASPSWGQGPGTTYYRELLKDIEQAKQDIERYS